MKQIILAALLIISTAEAHPFHQNGVASWYGPGFYGRRTSSGAIYTGRRLTAAHPSLPLGSRVRVTVLDHRGNHRSVVVVITDRGSFGRKYHRIIDLSPRAARSLHILHDGTARVSVIALRH